MLYTIGFTDRRLCIDSVVSALPCIQIVLIATAYNKKPRKSGASPVKNDTNEHGRPLLLVRRKR